ncbi:peptidoglycan DD-metalloendopeptidase family protein [Castellaniella sp.]|uniref:peptidoglycan DD-metalloendopeptidase family protein n=1 Tax=Castellaniella sp. TaxID=1955812 RepID=UPI00356106D4
MYHGTLPVTAALSQPLRWHRVALLAAVCSALVLAGCASRKAPAPVADHSSSAVAPAQGTYVVRSGDTLYGIAQKHGLTVDQLKQLNGITDPTQLAIGQVLRLDSGTARPVADAAVTAPVTTGSAGSSAAATPPAADTSSARAADANLIQWGWPASGKIIQGFNSTTKGVDIEGAVGSPVVAAADGKVMYAGNGVRGLGNLILLGHSDGFITAYAHNESLLVKTGETIAKGAKIATLGQSDTTSPRLHFEIRRRGTPVNPLAYLPPR